MIRQGRRTGTERVLPVPPSPPGVPHCHACGAPTAGGKPFCPYHLFRGAHAREIAALVDAWEAPVEDVWHPKARAMLRALERLPGWRLPGELAEATGVGPRKVREVALALQAAGRAEIRATEGRRFVVRARP